MRYSIENPAFYDLEVFPDYFMAGFKIPGVGVYQYVHTTGRPSIVQKILDMLGYLSVEHTLFGFNSHGYDDPVLTEYLRTGSPDAAYDMSQRIIVWGEKPWTFENIINSVDLMPILPNRISLKKIGVCLGHSKLQELPVRYDRTPDAEGCRVLPGYNINDLEITEKLYNEVYKELKLREALSNQYNVDLRSKGEATAAEAILLHELAQTGVDTNKGLLNKKARQIVDSNPRVDVFEPTWWDELVRNQKLPILSSMDYIFKTPIDIDYNGRLTKGSISSRVFIDDRFYAMGVGGLHSVDGPGVWIPKEDEVLLDLDVASFYPMIILTQKLYPRAWGEVFLDIYKSLVDRRIEAKRSGDKTTADVLKIVVNGTYGKTSELFSSLYDPKLTVNVTVTGQLALLTLIEMLVGVATVVSANTDGITVLLKRDMMSKLTDISKRWESITGLELEETPYLALYQRDINSYCAVKSGKDGEVSLKTKGIFIDTWPDLRHTPSANIIATAIANKILYNKGVGDTVSECQDINQFLLTQSVTGKTTTSWNGKPLGKVLRFYKSYRSDSAPIIRTTEDGNTSIVSDSEATVPLEDLPDSLPPDINRVWYTIRAAELWDKIARPKLPGMNRWAELMESEGLKPCYVDPKKPSAAGVVRGELDFTSIPKGEVMGVKTGCGVIARVWGDGRTEFFATEKEYPPQTRDLVSKKEGFKLLYRVRTPLTGLIKLNPPVDWDEFYTPAELKKVGR
jgi:hypothetical protein